MTKKKVKQIEAVNAKRGWRAMNVILMKHDALRDRFYRGINRVGRLQTTRWLSKAERFDPTSKASLKAMAAARKYLEQRGWSVVYMGVRDPFP